MNQTYHDDEKRSDEYHNDEYHNDEAHDDELPQLNDQKIDAVEDLDMLNESDTFDEHEIEFYMHKFNLADGDGDARRGRRPKVTRSTKKAREDVLATIADLTVFENDFQTSYKPTRHEETWLPYSLATFFQQDLISDVLARVKGGKEANVYCCRGHSTSEEDLLAVKVYRPRKLRNLRNDAMYREGRRLLSTDGRPIKETDRRTLRALGKKTGYGAQVQHTSWLMHEFRTLERLHRDGGAVPRPIAASENAILMGYVGDEQTAAPTLHEIGLDKGEAEVLFQEVLRNIELMLQQELIHGDLSAYNILYWSGQITLIDFPQVTDLRANRNARFILRRDIERVCEYFGRFGVACDASGLLDELWNRYAAEDPLDALADLSRLDEALDDE